MLTKAIVILVLIAILYCLGSGLVSIAKQKNNSAALAKALTWRIALSFLLFILLFIAYYFGWLVPHQ